MQENNIIKKSLLKNLRPKQLSLLIGEITTLLMVSKVHRKYQVRDIADIILPAINLNQFKIYRDSHNRPVALVTWGLLSEEVESRYLKGHVLLSEADLVSGNLLYFIDFIAPYGHLKKVIIDLKTNLFPNDLGKSLRVTGNQNPTTKVMKFYGRNYKKPSN